MNFKTKYDVGHVFYAPRCYQRTVTESFVDDNDNTWSREVEMYAAIVKARVIVGVIIKHKVTTSVFYQYLTCGNEHNGFDVPSQISEEDIGNLTESEAWTIAESYRARGEELFSYPKEGQ